MALAGHVAACDLGDTTGEFARPARSVLVCNANHVKGAMTTMNADVTAEIHGFSHPDASRRRGR